MNNSNTSDPNIPEANVVAIYELQNDQDDPVEIVRLIWKENKWTVNGKDAVEKDGRWFLDDEVPTSDEDWLLDFLKNGKMGFDGKRYNENDRDLWWVLGKSRMSHCFVKIIE